jgi:type 1 glutamine amidotransferase
MRAHLITGGFPPGSPAGHDMDYARLRLLELLHEHVVNTTVAGDFTDVDKWLGDSQLLLTYVAGPFPDAAQNALLEAWLENGGRWIALHGTSGGKAIRTDGPLRKFVKLPHHQTLGSFFLNHPPLRKFRVDVHEGGHPLMKNLPTSFEVEDELYMIEMMDGNATPLLTTELPEDPSPPGFGYIYDEDTSLLADGKTRVLGYLREVGKGAVVYWALGHCHSSLGPADDGSASPAFHGVWESSEFRQLLSNSLTWAG